MDMLMVSQQGSPLFVLVLLFILTCILGVMWFLFSRVKWPNLPAAIDSAQKRITAEITAVRAKTPTFFTQTTSPPTLPPNQSFLVNICPLTAYVGTLGKPENVMSAEVYLKTALQAGIRSFVLPISTYINSAKEPPMWPYSGEPALVARDTSETIVSMNGLTMDSFVSALLQYKSVSGFGTDPIFLMIRDTIPEVDRKKMPSYTNFMKKIAASLAPLDPYRLTSVGSLGSVVGGLKQNELLTQVPLSSFASKIIIFTDFDVSQDPSLASYANFLPEDASVRSVGASDLAGTTVNYVSNARTRWYNVESSDPLVAPTVASVELALSSGLQCIPIPFLSTPMESIKDIWALWKGGPYILKEENARYTQPAPVVPARPSQALNASIQGKQPGNLAVN